MEVSHEARRIHASSIVIDTHVDTVVRWIDLEEDLGIETGNGYMDLPLMKRGNLTASFFACCVGFHHVARGHGDPSRSRHDRRREGDLPVLSG